MDETKKQLQATQEKLRAEQEYHQELSQAEKEAHAEALREAEERAAADEVMQRLAEEKAERRRAREQKREELAERERVDAAVAKQRVPSGRPPSMTRSKKGSGDMGNALEAEIQRLQGEKSRREIERKEERARREEDHRLRAEKKSRRQKARGTDSEEKVDREDGQDFGRDYKEKERQAVMAVKAAMAEKFAAQEETECASVLCVLRSYDCFLSRCTS
jgi:translation initiation factor 4G